MDKPKNNTNIVLIVVILCLSGICALSIIVFGSPFANRLADRFFKSGNTEGLELSFNGSFDGKHGEKGYQTGLTFVPGHSGKAVMFNQENSLYYQAEDNINREQGSIEFWLKPLWDGNDGGSYVFFEIGDSWFNRFRIIKDGANNFRFMVWSADVEYDAACSVDNWVADEWHHVRATWLTDSISLYLDGELCDTQTFVMLPDSLSPHLFIGSSAQGDTQAQAVIDDFIISPDNSK